MPTTDAAHRQLPFAHGGPLGTGVLRSKPQDFIVDEIASFEFSDDGEHDYLFVEKTEENTDRVAGWLAQHAGVARRDVGFAGRKDRIAVTRQWFSVRRPNRDGTNWSNFNVENVHIVDVQRCRRKLKTGSLTGNRFRIRLRDVDLQASCPAARLADIARYGVPNYFGPQRFGRNGSNIASAQRLFEGKRLRRNERSLALSAARSLLFNQVTAKRVADHTWNQAIAGDVFNLDGSNAYFGPEPANAALLRRIDCLDVHPTGVLWGAGDIGSTDDMLVLEQQVAAANHELASGLEKAGVVANRRALRANVFELDWQLSDNELELTFRLGKGSYATSVLRELVNG